MQNCSFLGQTCSFLGQNWPFLIIFGQNRLKIAHFRDRIFGVKIFMLQNVYGLPFFMSKFSGKFVFSFLFWVQSEFMNVLQDDPSEMIQWRCQITVFPGV